MKECFKVEVNSLSCVRTYKSEKFHSIPEAYEAYASEIEKQIDEKNHVYITLYLIKYQEVGYTLDILKQCTL